MTIDLICEKWRIELEHVPAVVEKGEALRIDLYSARHQCEDSVDQQQLETLPLDSILTVPKHDQWMFFVRGRSLCIWWSARVPNIRET